MALTIRALTSSKIFIIIEKACKAVDLHTFFATFTQTKVIDMKYVSLIVAAVMLTISCNQATVSPQDALTVNDERINEIIASLTLEEKVEMLHSKTIMSSAVIERLGIQDIRYADGPFGIREELGDGFRPLGWENDYATYFPTGSALAATWSEDVAYLYGTGMGREARLRGKDIILGPAINIQRIPTGGRSYEYLSEDPYLSARLTVGYTRGAQDAGTAVCLKHFAVNNQELNRSWVNSVVDERTLREIYLKPFQAGVEEGGAMAVMTAYNKVNGTYCSENAHLNNEILRGEWGFKGLTVSDWGGTHSTMGAALGGLDVQMTGNNYLGPALIDSVRNGAVDESVVDDKVREILRVRFAVAPVPEDVANTEMTSKPEQQKIAYDVALKSIVLLKNEGAILPLRSGKIAVVGPNAELKTAQGGVGAGVKTPYEVTVLQGLIDRAEGREIVYSADDPEIARDADAVIFVCGTNREIESEGRDRNDIFLPEGQEELLSELYAINPNIITVNLSGGACDLRNAVSMSRALVQGWWNGMEGGHAMADILFGNAAPSGKLPFTFPEKLEDSPAYALGNYPQIAPEGVDFFSMMFRRDRKESRGDAVIWSPEAHYTEGPLVGYRWYDTKNVPVLYAFGHGLSYVDFEYSNLKVSRRSDCIEVCFKVRNTGDMPADEVCQVYVHRENSPVDWPVKELKGFSRVSIGAGSSEKVKISIPFSELRYWDIESGSWRDDACDLEILVGSASDDIRLSASLK